jgi:hypothetical protein
MQLAVSAPMADTIWTAMLIFLAAIILGICILIAYSFYNIECDAKNRVRFDNCNYSLIKKERINLLPLQIVEPLMSFDEILLISLIRANHFIEY